MDPSSIDPGRVVGAIGAGSGLLAILLGRAAAASRSGFIARLGLALSGVLAGVGVVCLAGLSFVTHRGHYFFFRDGIRVADPFERANGFRRYSPNQRLRSLRTLDDREGGEKVFDVTYTIDAFGNRATPAAPGQPAVLFMGCSFTFGNGLDDADTLPWRFAEATHGRLDVVNAAISGAGAHQMLRMLELGLEDARLADGVSRIFYAAIPDHVRRAAIGLPDTWGPHYEIDASDGRLLLEEPEAPWGALLGRAARRVLGEDWAYPGQRRTLGPNDDERWARIVARMAGIARERWQAPFTALLWDGNASSTPGPGRSPRVQRLATLLQSHGVEAVTVESLISRDAIRRIPVDGHPAASTNGALASALARRFFPEFSCGPGRDLSCGQTPRSNRSP